MEQIAIDPMAIPASFRLAEVEMLPRWKSKLVVLIAGFFGAGVAMASPADTLQILMSGTQGQPSKHLSLSTADLEALVQKQFVTTTPWHEGKRAFSGPTIRMVLQSKGIRAAAIRATAHNDYFSMIDESDFDEAIIATRLNGHPMRLRDKGPYWIIYNIDSDPKYRTQTYISQMVWQVRAIEALASK